MRKIRRIIKAPIRIEVDKKSRRTLPANAKQLGKNRIMGVRATNRARKYHKPSLVEKYKFNPKNYSLTIHEDSIKENCINKSLWVIGTGYGLTLLDKKLVSQINQKITLAFHNSYPHCTKFGINPTYWTWLDPSAAMPGLNILKKQKKEKAPIPLIHRGLTGDGLNFRKYFGNTLVQYEEYHNSLVKVSEHYPICILPGTSLKALPFTDAKTAYENPEKRTKHGVLVGSAYDYKSGKVRTGDKHAKVENGMFMTENKFSSYIIPLAHYLGFNNIIYVGFEGIGPRFFAMNNTRIGAGRPGYDLGMQNWSKWAKSLGIKIYSLIPNGKSRTTKYFNYIKLEEALKRF